MRNVLIIICLFLSVPICAQVQRGYNWITGLNGNRINFNSANVTTYLGNYVDHYFHGGNSCISDNDGNLLLTSDGYSIYNSFGNYVEDGDTLVPLDLFNFEDGWSAESESSIFLPMDSGLYYFITPTMSDTRFSDCNANNNCHFDLLLYNVIDMNANGGAGKVMKRMIPLMQNANLRKTQMMACRHGNGKDWWLLKNEGDSANIHVLLFTQDSVYDKGVQIFNEPVWGEWDLRGQSTFNYDGSKFATTSQGGALINQGLIFLSDFDRCSGLLSNPRVIEMPVGSAHDTLDPTKIDKQSGGLCFSPNSRFLYVSSYVNIYQYDFWDSTWYHVAGLDTTFNAAQAYNTAYLGPDNRVYIGNFGGSSKQMSRIDSPDVKGVGCSFCPRCLRMDSLSGLFSLGTPPCMPNYGLGAKTCWPLSTNEVVHISPEINIYPNPAIDKVTISASDNFSDIRIYTMLSQLVFEMKSNPVSQIEINTQGLPSGIYLVQIDGKYSRKLVVE